MNLQNLIRSEFGSDVVMESEKDKDLEKVIDEELKKGGNADIERITTALTKTEYWYFTQGFIRGIAAAKGGAV